MAWTFNQFFIIRKTKVFEFFPESFEFLYDKKDIGVFID